MNKIQDIKDEDDDFISLEKNADIEEKSLKNHVNDLDEGAGFEEEPLVVDEGERLDYEEAQRMERMRLVNEYEQDEDDGDDGEWERNLIAKGASNSRIADQIRSAHGVKLKDSDDHPLPDWNSVVDKLRRQVDQIEVEKGNKLEEIARLNDQKERIDAERERVKQQMQDLSMELNENV